MGGITMLCMEEAFASLLKGLRYHRRKIYFFTYRLSSEASLTALKEPQATGATGG